MDKFIQLLMKHCLETAESIYNYCKEDNLLNSLMWIEFLDKINKISTR